MTEGLLIGGSCGLAVAAGLQVAARANPRDLIVVLIPDSGRGYLSRVFNDEWMAGLGFRRECDRCVGSVLATRSTDTPELVYVNPDHTVRAAIELMRHHEISQIPVCKNTPPFALAEVSGAVDELHLMELAFQQPEMLDRFVKEVMGPKLPTIGVGQALEMAVNLLDVNPAVLVLSGGRPQAVLSRSDLLQYLSNTGELR